jgi:hypothetical protein
VAAFQVWNEPNLPDYLAPQWAGNATVAPALYRQMLNAFYAGLKSVDPSALVLTAGTAPFGDPEPGGRIMPVRFDRELLCVRQTGSGGLAGTGCRNPAHFDVLAHQPYSVGYPQKKALWPDDVSIPDLGKLTRVLRAAERSGGALPRIHHPLWVTEVGYNTKPPNPYGVPIAEDARWVDEVLNLIWSQSVPVVIWNQVGDQPPIPSYGLTSQSGVYYLSGQPKPALAAFRFPLMAWSTGGGSVEQVWGRAPSAGLLEIQISSGNGWQTVQTLHVGTQATFLSGFTIPARFVHARPLSVRARVASQVSPAWLSR